MKIIRTYRLHNTLTRFSFQEMIKLGSGLSLSGYPIQVILSSLNTSQAAVPSCKHTSLLQETSIFGLACKPEIPPTRILQQSELNVIRRLMSYGNACNPLSRSLKRIIKDLHEKYQSYLLA